MGRGMADEGPFIALVDGPRADRLARFAEKRPKRLVGPVWFLRAPPPKRTIGACLQVLGQRLGILSHQETTAQRCSQRACRPMDEVD